MIVLPDFGSISLPYKSRLAYKKWSLKAGCLTIANGIWQIAIKHISISQKVFGLKGATTALPLYIWLIIETDALAAVLLGGTSL